MKARQLRKNVNPENEDYAVTNSVPCNYYILKPQIHHGKRTNPRIPDNIKTLQHKTGKDTVLDEKGDPIVHTMCLPQSQVDELLKQKYKKGAKQSGYTTKGIGRHKDKFFITKEDYESMAGTEVDDDYSKFKVCPYRTNDKGKPDLNGQNDIGGSGIGEWQEFCE